MKVPLKYNRWLTLLFLCVVSLPYVANLHGDYFYDDIHTVVENPFVIESHSLYQYFFEPSDASGSDFFVFRPLTFLSHRLNHLMGSGATWPFHLTNILLHLTCALLLALLGRLILNYTSKLEDREINFITTLAVAFWATHPLTAQSVNYIADRAVLLSSLFTVLCIIFFLLSQRRSGARRRFAILSVLCLAVALCCKEIAITTLGLLLLFELALFRWRFEGRRARLTVYASMMLISAGYMVMRFSMFHSFDVTEASDITNLFLDRYTYLATQIVVAWKYILQIFAPYDFYVMNNMQPVNGLGDPRFIVALVLTLLLIIATIVFKTLRLPLLLGSGWFIMGILVTSSIFPLYLLFNPNRVYLASYAPIFLFTLASYLLYSKQRSQIKRLFTLGGSIMFLSLWIYCWMQAVYWSDRLLITSAMFQRAAANPAAVFAYATTLDDRGYREQTMQLLKDNIESLKTKQTKRYPLDSYQYHARWHERYALNLVKIDLDLALSHLDTAIKLWPRKDRLWFNFATALYLNKETTKAGKAMFNAKELAQKNGNKKLIRKIILRNKEWGLGLTN